MTTYLLTTPVRFALTPDEQVVRFSPDMDYRQFIGDDVVVVGASGKAGKLTDLVDALMFYKPRTLQVWVADTGRWVTVIDDTGRWIADVPPPDDIFDEVMAHASH